MGRLRVAFDAPRELVIDAGRSARDYRRDSGAGGTRGMLPPGTELTVRGAGELRDKESDRISALAPVSARWGPRSTSSPTASSSLARRSAARGRRRRRSSAGDGVRDCGVGATGPTTITGAAAVDVSYPGFFDDARSAHARVTVDKVFLVGFMGAGKTTVARALAGRLGWRVEDVDELIEARERRTVADIFARQGEPYFRARRARDPAAVAAAPARWSWPPAAAPSPIRTTAER